jgi:hypothetical protein
VQLLAKVLIFYAFLRTPEDFGAWERTSRAERSRDAASVERGVERLGPSERDKQCPRDFYLSLSALGRSLFCSVCAESVVEATCT